jgi:GDSL-like Lipase/Acylhydrolase family
VIDQREAATPGSPAIRRRLARHDFFLIPLLILVTAIVLFASAEIGTRIIWPAYHAAGCEVRNQQLDSVHSLPNCSVKDKIAEGPWVSYDYNACGYRTFDPCGPKPSGVLRVAFLGSSITQGYHVPYDETFAQLTTRALAATTALTVQNENLGYQGLSPLQNYHKVPETLALHPDVVIYAVSPFDLEEKTDPAQLAGRNNLALRFDRPAVTIHISPLKRLANLLQVSRTATIAQHFLYSNTDTYMRLSLSRGDKTDYLRTPLPPAWQARFADFALILTDMADRFREAGIPFVVVAIPSHQIGALLSSSEHPPHTDPFEFGRDLRTLAEQVGAVYVDGTEAMRDEAHSDRLFYLSEAHLNSAGHSLIAHALMDKLQSSVIPALTMKRDN